MDEYNFQKLTPIHDAKLGIYENALDFVFKNDDIKNVAVSGAYSAGKSSVLETYKKKHDDIKFLHISLAHFKASDEKEDTKVKESVLEGKILNQLIHKIDSDKIPQTNFRVKRKINNKSVVWTVILTMLAFVMALHLFMFAHWQTFVESLSVGWIKNILSLTTYSGVRILSGTVLLIALGFALYEIIQIQKNRNILRRINLNGAEIEIFEKSEESYFDKYLNEVIYLFENAEADVIVFEDMDRYDANQIFERLREINTLVNNQHSKENKKPLRFFYLLRDDIFVSKDRTKFFDYIMPVVPVIDSSNSYDQFIEHFKKGGIFEKFKENFLQDVSLYVDDMRILKNIYNEFLVYNGKINTTEQDYNKLLALIIYKNIFPRDFSDLQLNKGFVYTLFAKKEEFIANEIESIDKKIKEIQEKIEAANNEHLTESDEVTLIYSPKIQDANRYYDRDRRLKPINEEIAKRKENIENKSVEKMDALKHEIDLLVTKKSNISNKKLYQIITRNNINGIFEIKYTNEIGKVTDFNEIKESSYFDLIKYLIRNGYIDETYADYMTYFYENSISRIDKTFLRSVSDKKSKEYTYQLTNPQMVADRLSDVAFDEEETLNFDLLCFLLTASKYEKQLNRLFLQIRNEKAARFIQGFFDTKREVEQFVSKLNKQWHHFFYDISRGDTFTKEQTKQFSIYTLYYSQDILDELNYENCLTDYISVDSDYMDIENPNIEKLIVAFQQLDVCFKSINHSLANKELFAAVYENNLYLLTFEHICLMLNCFYGLDESDDYNHKNYTLVSSVPNSPLLLYVNENINSYIEIIVGNCKENICDDEMIALSVINNDEASIENKTAYIEVLTTQIKLLKEVTDKNIWTQLLQHGLIEYSESNILQYFFDSENGLDGTLVEFINSGNTPLDFSTSIDDFGEDAPSEFFRAAIVCSDLDNKKYSETMKSLNRIYNSFSTKGITEEKIDILIDLKIIKMSQDSLLFLRTEYPDNTLHFIEKNIDIYVNEVVSDETFDFDEMVEVLSLDVSDDNKITLMENTNEPISIVGSDYTNAVKVYILNNNLAETDIPSLLVSYTNENDTMKLEIEKLAMREKQTVLSEQYSLSIGLFDKLFSNTSLSNEDKVEFLILVLPSLDERQATSYLTELQLHDYVGLFERKRPKFEATDVNERLLEIFKNKNWITKFEVDKDDTGYYRAFGRKLQEELPNELL